MAELQSRQRENEEEQCLTTTERMHKLKEKFRKEANQGNRKFREEADRRLREEKERKQTNLLFASNTAVGTDGDNANCKMPGTTKKLDEEVETSTPKPFSGFIGSTLGSSNNSLALETTEVSGWQQKFKSVDGNVSEGFRFTPTSEAISTAQSAKSRDYANQGTTSKPIFNFTSTTGISKVTFGRCSFTTVKTGVSSTAVGKALLSSPKPAFSTASTTTIAANTTNATGSVFTFGSASAQKLGFSGASTLFGGMSSQQPISGALEARNQKANASETAQTSNATSKRQISTANSNSKTGIFGSFGAPCDVKTMGLKAGTSEQSPVATKLQTSSADSTSKPSLFGGFRFSNKPVVKADEQQAASEVNASGTGQTSPLARKLHTNTADSTSKPGIFGTSGMPNDVEAIPKTGTPEPSPMASITQTTTADSTSKPGSRGTFRVPDATARVAGTLEPGQPLPVSSKPRTSTGDSTSKPDIFGSFGASGDVSAITSKAGTLEPSPVASKLQASTEDFTSKPGIFGFRRFGEPDDVKAMDPKARTLKTGQPSPVASTLQTGTADSTSKPLFRLYGSTSAVQSDEDKAASEQQPDTKAKPQEEASTSKPKPFAGFGFGPSNKPFPPATAPATTTATAISVPASSTSVMFGSASSISGVSFGSLAATGDKPDAFTKTTDTNKGFQGAGQPSPAASKPQTSAADSASKSRIFGSFGPSPDATGMAPKSGTSEPSSVASKPQTGTADSTDKPNVFEGFTFSSKPVVTPDETKGALEQKPDTTAKPQEEANTSKPKPFAGFSFGASNNPLSPAAAPATTATAISVPASSTSVMFGSASSISGVSFGSLAATRDKPDAFTKTNDTLNKGFQGAGQRLLKKLPTKDSKKSATDHGKPDDYEAQMDFKPMVTVPEVVDLKTGGEDEEQLFRERGKLFRHDMESKQWKERGVGDWLLDSVIGRMEII